MIKRLAIGVLSAVLGLGSIPGQAEGQVTYPRPFNYGLADFGSYVGVLAERTLYEPQGYPGQDIPSGVACLVSVDWALEGNTVYPNFYRVSRYEVRAWMNTDGHYYVPQTSVLLRPNGSVLSEFEAPDPAYIDSLWNENGFMNLQSSYPMAARHQGELATKCVNGGITEVSTELESR